MEEGMDLGWGGLFEEPADPLLSATPPTAPLLSSAE